MQEFKVIGSFEIAGKCTGELVRLDPNEVNIQALIDGGHIERVSKPQSAKETK